MKKALRCALHCRKLKLLVLLLRCSKEFYNSRKEIATCAN